MLSQLSKIILFIQTTCCASSFTTNGVQPVVLLTAFFHYTPIPHYVNQYLEIFLLYSRKSAPCTKVLLFFVYSAIKEISLLAHKKLVTIPSLLHKLKRAITGICLHGLFTRKASSFASCNFIVYLT